VSFTLHDDASGALRSGERIETVLESLSSVPLSGVLANCCSPESIDAAMPEIAGSGKPFVGGYANTFRPIPADWTLDGERETDGLLPTRDDLDPDSYAKHALRWLSAGATIVGGCCGTGPDHVARLRRLVDEIEGLN
jgi:S-methylmethionine-dependent homocysteine/selenocysteine methylase